jgi:hypothetical protein
MYSKTNKSINSPTEFTEISLSGANKASTACTVQACKAPTASKCVLQ